MVDVDFMADIDASRHPLFTDLIFPVLSLSIRMSAGQCFTPLHRPFPFRVFGVFRGSPIPFTR